jgi:hypothetical protein
MIEAYLFLAAFTVQILVMSVLLPAWYIRNFRVKVARLPADRLAQLYPGVDAGPALERFLFQYRVLTSGIAVLGLLVLGWLYSDPWRTAWNKDVAGFLSTAYFLVAMLLPLLLFGRSMNRFNKEYRLTATKRTANLRRRGLFDFVSPFAVFLAVMTYFLYVAFLFYIEQHPFPGFAGPLINIVGVTLIYAVNAFGAYIVLYGKKSPLDTQEARQHAIGLAVKGFVYATILLVVAMSLTHLFRMLELKSWEPFAGSIFYAILAVLTSLGFASPLREREAEPA